jgi:hypothetical protein
VDVQDESTLPGAPGGIRPRGERDPRVVPAPDATSGTHGRGLSELSDVGVATRDAAETVDWPG